MCGIAVALDWPEAETAVARLIDGIRHRGDVSDPVFAPLPHTAMATRRLRIVDAARAVQPQLSHDGRLAVSFNGEIYNHARLRAELEDAGVRFATDSDTEVLANALRVWGHHALARLNGMYAFVALDLQTGNFLAARDPFGVKPLYLIHSGSSYLFCSEMRPLLDTVETGDVLLLPPGYGLTAAGCARFASPLKDEPKRLMKGDAVALDRILADAVGVRIPPDLPAAVLFSGGIDSTLVAHYARQHRPQTPGYFVGSVHGPDFRYAAEYAAVTGFDLRIVPFEPDSDEVFDSIERVVEVCESFEPNLVRGAVCSLMAAERMRQDGFRVGLCGEGADELFCGYAPLEIAFGADDANARAIRADVLSLMHRVSLQRVDRAAMRYQVELREPFLDPAVANYALQLDGAALVREKNGVPVGKQPLRDLYALYADTLPASIGQRAKVPFGEGAGLDVTPERSGWKRRFHDLVSDADFRDGQRQFAAFRPQSKEELYYMRKLAQSFDVMRVPHLRDRAWISFDMAQHGERLKAYAHASL
jgi:asparagine synthase (glutamine-hydrolysing)